MINYALYKRHVIYIFKSPAFKVSSILPIKHKYYAFLFYTYGNFWEKVTTKDE